LSFSRGDEGIRGAKLRVLGGRERKAPDLNRRKTIISVDEESGRPKPSEDQGDRSLGKEGRAATGPSQEGN